MADDELEAIRRQRMAELQAKHGVRKPDHNHLYYCREADMRNTILAQVLDQSARARCKYAKLVCNFSKKCMLNQIIFICLALVSNLALVKPEKAKDVENYLIQMARFGQLGGKISESGLIEILEKVSQQTQKKTTVKFNRQRVMDSDDEDDY
ncbi:hypothetical protein NQD34_001940 [Periophthalmus magnuspinnatus]|nr:hypothetical protein NQD34_001940 [Periophthalmus magnuspinnatus]